MARQQLWPGAKAPIATNPNGLGQQLLTGEAARLASIPLDPSIRGGLGDAFRGVLEPRSPNGKKPSTEEPDQFAGMGPILEDEDAKVFQVIDGLVQRQELIALNHLAIDTHWTYVKLLGYPSWSTLTKDPNRDRWTQGLDYGAGGVSMQPVPNKTWDLINKTKEALLVDFPQAEAEPGDDSEEAEAACDMANRFLAQDASEDGTNDAVLWNDRVDRALTCGSSYVEGWVDPTGGGYVPLQIPAHPQAESPANPLVGPDGMPTTSPILRYVTEVGPDGQPTETSQFTDDPTKAAPQWQPKIMAAKWQREHIRVFPESKPVEQAEKVIILGYCTLGEAKRRWPSVAEMLPEDLTKLTDWTPVRYLALLPMFQRGRWKLTDGRDKEKQGASDERIMFYYHPYIKACPDYKKGADVVVTGAFGGKVLSRKLLAKDVEVPAKAEDGQQRTRKETRCMEIPVVQITPRQDTDEQDPTGRPYIEMIAGASENNAHLAMSFSEALDKNLHLEAYAMSTSNVDGITRENARATGDIIPIISLQHMPQWGPFIPLPESFFRFYEVSDEAINSIGSAERAAKGQDNAGEKSGKAIQLATANNNVSLGGMSHAVNNSYARWSRIKIELALSEFTTAQQINYVGDDGIFKQEEWKGTDFALVGKMTIKTGTGGLLTHDQKVENLVGLAQAGVLSIDEAKDAARPAFSRKLGLPADAHEQRIERQITAFNKGIPNEEWPAQWAEYQKLLPLYETAQAEQAQEQTANAAAAPLGPGGEPVNTAPASAPLQPPPKPWTPFMPLPTDEEPLIAAMRARRLGKLIDSAKFEALPPEWQQVAIEEYQRMRAVESAAAQAAMQAEKPQGKPQPGQSDE